VILFTVFIPLDVDNYYKEHVKQKRDKKRIKFPNPLFGSFSKPLTVVDVKGWIVLWYLPGLLSTAQKVVVFRLFKSKHLSDLQQSEIRSATVSIAPLLRKSLLSK
jgi:hypothetical protein